MHLIVHVIEYFEDQTAFTGWKTTFQRFFKEGFNKVFL